VTYVLYGATLAFTWFLVLNVSLSLMVAATARPISARLTALSPEVRARWLLALRLLPAAVSILFVAGVFLPSFFVLEPRHFDEAFGVTTTTFAVASCALVATALWRGAAALGDAARRSRLWIERAQPIVLGGAPGPVFCLDAPVPAMTLVGVFRPKLLVTRPLLDLLTTEELRASVAHEVAHFGSWDNLKRLLMRAVPDALSVLRASRRIEHDWAQAAEHAADSRAALDDSTRLALASALVKIARLTPPVQPLTAALASPLVGGEGIASRVARLMDTSSPERRSAWLAPAGGTAIAIGAALTIVATYRPLIHAVHQISEVVVRVLP
jgi:Zn-dependent protease with chaperone function